MYLADVVSSLDHVATAGTILSLITAVFCLLGVILDNESLEELKLGCSKISKFLWIPLVFVLLMVFVPSKNTMYAIAASEIGEDVAKEVSTSPLYNKAQAALNNWLDKQLGKEKKPILL